MEELLAVMNPRRRASAKQLAWRRKFVARYGRGARRNPANPKRRRPRARRNPGGHGAMVPYVANPRRRRARRNPRPFGGAFMGALMAGLSGAGGGVALDLVMRFLPLPMKTGPMNLLMRGVGSVGIGLLGGMMPGAAGRLGVDMGTGAFSITLYNAARQYVTVPMGLGEFSDDEIAEVLNPSPMVYDEGVGEYVLSQLPGEQTPVYEGVGAYDEEE